MRTGDGRRRSSAGRDVLTQVQPWDPDAGTRPIDALAVDERHVYFVVHQASDALTTTERWKVSKCGGRPTLIAPENVARWPGGIAIDEQWIYWSNYEGNILRIAK